VLVALALRALDPLPLILDLVGGLQRGALAFREEHVRVAADQLLAVGIGDRGEVTGAALLEKQGQEHDLEQEVAELIDELGVVALTCRLGDLVRLLDRVRDDRALVLLAVPRALLAKAVGDIVEARERLS
jgi:hypothetical protein